MVWLVIDHLIILVGWRGISFRVVSYAQSLVLLQHYHFLQVSLRFDYASTGLTLLHEAHILLVGSGAFIVFLSDVYGGGNSVFKWLFACIYIKYLDLCDFFPCTLNTHIYTI